MIDFVKSIVQNDTEALSGIMKLNNIGRIDLDLTYSIGKFYKSGIEEPIIKFDKMLLKNINTVADSKNIPLKSESVNSVVYDPPFMFGNHGQQKNYSATKRYTMYKSFDELEKDYKGTLTDCFRVLKNKGYLIFKCQDFTDSKTTMLHCMVYNWAVESGFYAKDLLIHINTFKILNTKLKQRHARKFHSYWFVFQKSATGRCAKGLGGYCI